MNQTVMVLCYVLSTLRPGTLLMAVRYCTSYVDNIQERAQQLGLVNERRHHSSRLDEQNVHRLVDL